MTPFAWVLLFLMALGAVSFATRFLKGLGGSTGLSDTYPWGLWIVFDLVWIALAAGAFATAGLIYVFQRKDLYSMGRSAVLMGLLSYTFVTVTLIADLGLPLHSYQLALRRRSSRRCSRSRGASVSTSRSSPSSSCRSSSNASTWRRRRSPGSAWSGVYVAFATAALRVHAVAQLPSSRASPW
jgi:hypothetical protein